MNPVELQELLSKKEGLKLDFKQEYKLYDVPPANTDKRMWDDYVRGQWDELIKDVIALANGNVGTAGQDGLLIIGVDDELPPSGTRQIYDTSQLKITEQQVLAKVNSACDPPIPNLTCERIEVVGKQVVVITIHSSPYFYETSRQLETTKGDFDASGALRYFRIDKTYSPRTAFVRRGESVFPATDDERRAISFEKVAHLQQKLDYVELDRQLFLEIRRILESDGTIDYVREASFDSVFETRYLQGLYDFESFCKHPECEFMDIEMENKRKQLLSAIEAFLHDGIGQHTFRERFNPEWSRIPRDPIREPEMIAWFREKAKTEEEFNELVEKQREYIRRIGRELNRLASQICTVYDEFVRLGRRRLAV
ncbi:MAG TPA: putative DNA binding domain-containing protein [Anaerolineae bacterium]|nr:putative DNA binding domain-containing protein [Anaerolineae bacterium]HQK14131.1 putative DNA binding domain-containing protein [Anaerolineae bacterium]